MKLSIIVPVYNEARTIETAIQRILSVILPHGLTKEILVINDGSTDSTACILKQFSCNPAFKIFHRATVKGKGSAIKLGIENSSGDILLIQDADLEYSPDCYPSLVEPIVTRQVSIVYGSRFKGSIRRMSFINRISNIISNVTLNALFGTRVTDVNTCYKVFAREALQGIEIKSSGFQFDTEITAKFLNKGCRIYEVPISYEARLKREGKKMDWPQALQMYLGLIKYRFNNGG